MKKKLEKEQNEFRALRSLEPSLESSTSISLYFVKNFIHDDKHKISSHSK